jgi:hypothetical protein
MATQIVISNNESIKIDDSFHMAWGDKGNAMPVLPDTAHYVIWNTLTGQNEIQNKDASTGAMTGNVALNATSDAVGSTTIADLLTWGETRKGEIETATADYSNAYENALNAWISGGGTEETFTDSEAPLAWDWSKTWIDYDPHYS